MDWFLPAYKAGGPIQSIANLVREMENWPVECFIFCGNKDLDGTLVKEVEFDQWVDFNQNTKVWYATGHNFNANLKQILKNIKPDILFVNGIYSWRFNFLPLIIGKSAHRIVSARGMLHPGALSQKRFKKQIYLSLWKLAGFSEKVSFHATDNKEAQFIKNTFGNNISVKVAGNFPGVLPLQNILFKKPGQLKLVSVALISPMKNHLLVLEALSNINDTMAVSPDIYYNICGPVKEHDYWELCKEQMKRLPSNIKVNYMGETPPREIVKILADNHLFILPSKSENFGHAIYESLTAGRPVITSNNTPWNKLKENKAGINVSLNNSYELVNALQFFVAMGEEELLEWSSAARSYALHAVNFDSIRNEYKEMFGLDL